MEALASLRQVLQDKKIAFATDVPMKENTTFKIGGPAKLIIEPASTGEVAFCMAYMAEHGLSPFVLGNGSNLLVSDEGIARPVLRAGKFFSDLALEGESGLVCGSGVSLVKVCAFAQQNGLSGLEFAFGIPGSAGGAAFMNAGAYGGEMKDCLVRCDHVAPDGEIGAFSGEELQLSYRHSVYSAKGYFITALHFALKRDDPAAIAGRMEEYMRRRKDKQPLEYPSAGSAFKRPVGGYASALIEQSGLKGFSVGGAQVSAKHAGFIINAGGATCADVQTLIGQIQKVVREKTGFELHCEVLKVE